MERTIVILTGNELRHHFFRKKMALRKGIRVLQTYCETARNLLESAGADTCDMRQQHLQAREQSEKDFFELFVNYAEDFSNPKIIERGSINDDALVQELATLNPELIIVYGASILRQPLLSLFEGRILNVHLGLSPYYRGSATNFWPLADGLPECVGATFMYIDAGIDTGEIIHQMRPVMDRHDTPSSIGNRLITSMTDVFGDIIIRFDELQKTTVQQPGAVRRFCRKKDYTEASVKTVYENFYKGMIGNYLNDKTTRDQRFPLVVSPTIHNESHHVPLCTVV